MKDQLLRYSSGSAWCPQTALPDPLPFDRTCAPGDRLYKGREWQLLAVNNIQQPLLAALCTFHCCKLAPPCCFHACEKTWLPPTASIAWEGVGETASDLQHQLTPRLPVFSLNLLPPFIAPKRGRVIFLGLFSASRLLLPLLIKIRYKGKPCTQYQTSLIFTNKKKICKLEVDI